MLFGRHALCRRWLRTSNNHMRMPILSSRHLSYKTRGRVYSTCVWSAMLHASETWPLTRLNFQRLQRNDRAMIRWIYNVKPEDMATVQSNTLLERLGLESLDLVLRERRLRWYGHVERSTRGVKAVCDLRVQGRQRPGRPKMSWTELAKRETLESGNLLCLTPLIGSITGD